MSSFSLLDIPRPVKTYHSTTYPRIALENTGFEGKGKTVFITGGASGIGEQISHAFANAGIARLVVASRSSGPLEKLKSDFSAKYPTVEVVTYSASVTDTTRMTEILHEVSQIDVLVLNAAAIHVKDNADAISDKDMEDTYMTNVLAYFTLVKTYLSLPAPPSGSKTLLNVSSAALQLILPNQAGYASSKAAFALMLQHFAAEQNALPEGTPAERRMRIFSYHPGAFYTPSAAKNVPKDAFEWEDIRLPADFAVWLAGPQSDFLHGRWVWAHWDVDELIALKDRVEMEAGFLTVGLVQ